MKKVAVLCTKSGVLYNTAIVNHDKMCYLEVICHHNKKFQAGGLDFIVLVSFFFFFFFDLFLLVGG